MGNLKYKIFRDLWVQKGRTLMVVLIIGINSFALGMIVGTRNLVIPGMQEVWQSMNPAMINLFISPGISRDELVQLSKVGGIAEIEGYNSMMIEWRLNPNEEWKTGTITARDNYQKQKMNKLELIEGTWPHGRVLINGQEPTVYGIPKGSTVELRVNKHIYHAPAEGLIYDPLAAPATFGGTAQFFVAQDYFEYLAGDRSITRVLIRTPQWNEGSVTKLADLLAERLKKMGYESGRWITDPNKHFFQDQMDVIFLLLGIMGVLSLVLGLLLVYNTINGIISSQTAQIGVMKAIGASNGQITRLYLTTVLIYGLITLAIFLPLGIFSAYALTHWLIESFGADIGAFQIDPTAVALQAGLALFAPLLAALLPIFSASRITVREALTTYGLSTNSGRLDGVLNRMRFFSRMAIITISNTFRHRGRVVMLQMALVLSALVFMMVVCVRDSVSYTVKDVFFKILGSNITLVFDKPVRIDYVESITKEFPGIKNVEMWGLASATIRPVGQPYTKDDEQVSMLGVPLPTHLYGYELRAGRWLDPKDAYAIVLNVKKARDIGVKVGDWVTVRYDEKKEQDFQVVGLIFDPILVPFSLINRDTLLKNIGSVDRTQSIWIQTTETGITPEESIAKQLRTYYTKNNIDVSAQRGIFGLGSDSTTATGNMLVQQFNFLLVLLGVIAIIIGAVGGVALYGTLSLSVQERYREIGVMRAIGASSQSIFRLFIGEGLILTWLSWLIALPFAIPASIIMVKVLAAAFNFDLLYKYKTIGAILWFIIITILAILASWFPARSATKISVRESIAYQ